MKHRNLPTVIVALALAAAGPALADTGYSDIFTVDLRTGSPPTASFTWSPVSPKVGQTVQFTDTSTGSPTSRSWVFGDGSTSTEQTPSHTYAAEGSYTVTLAVTNDEGSDSISQEVTVERESPEIDDPGEHVYIIPGSAHTPGKEGTSWVSDVVLWRGGTGDAHANLYFLESGRDNSGTTGKAFNVFARSSLDLPDIVGTTFGRTKASGAILVGSDVPIVVTSRTYNDAATGTYGQFVAGVPVGQAIDSGDTARLIQLTRNDQYRTNIGFANASGIAIDVQAELYDGDGAHVTTWSRTIQPYGFYQQTDIFGTDVSDGYALISSPTPGAFFFTYASVIDNRTGDPVFVTPGAGTASAGEVLYIAGSAHVNGTGGTRWRTNAEVHNPGATDAAFTIDLLKQGKENSSPLSKTFNLAAGRSVRYADALKDLFDFTGAAALRITPSSGTIMVTSRTYNEAPKGTYGQFIPAVRATDAIATGQSAPLVQLSQSALNNTGYRTNIGLVNTSDTAITVAIDLYDGNGGKLGTKTVNLKPYEYTQKDKIFTAFSSSTLDSCYAVLSTATSGGSFLAYGSVVDNRSGDPVYVPATGSGVGEMGLGGELMLSHRGNAIVSELRSRSLDGN